MKIPDKTAANVYISPNGKIYSPEYIREFSPGYVGGKRIAEAATDEEIVLLCKLSDEAAAQYNSYHTTMDYKKNIFKAITRRANHDTM